MKKEENFLFEDWENIRLNIPRGKYRLVMLDLWDHTADVIGDFNSVEEAKKYLKEYALLEEDQPDEDTIFVIYNDRGEVVYDLREYSPDTHVVSLPIEDDVGLQVNKNTEYIAVAIFLDENRYFEDLIFEEARTFEEAKKLIQKIEKEHNDANRLIILNKEGNIVWEKLQRSV